MTLEQKQGILDTLDRVRELVERVECDGAQEPELQLGKRAEVMVTSAVPLPPYFGPLVSRLLGRDHAE